MKFLKRLKKDRRGQALTEYAMVIALVSIGLVLALAVFRDSVGGIFDAIRTEQPEAVVQYAPGDGSGGPVGDIDVHD